MKHFRKYLFLFFLLHMISCTSEEKQVPLSYQLPDEISTPVLFADGKITTSNGINFSNDGNQLYISKPIDKTFENGRSFAGIFHYKYQNDTWEALGLIDFENRIDAYHPVLSPDNKTLFFNSRSHPDSIYVSIPHNIWYSKKLEKGWSNPEIVEVIHSPFYDSYPTIAKNNNIYINSDRPGGKGGMDIYMSKYLNGKYQKPLNVKNLNSSDAENDLVVDPNEQFIIFNRYVNATKELDLYISFKEGNDWGIPKPLSKINDKSEWELTPTLSPNGKYFFYELNGNIMQISMKELIEGLN